MRHGLLGVALAACVGLAVGEALAEPGLGTHVYGAVVDQGKLELETRFGALNGGLSGGTQAVVTELSYGLTDYWYGAAVAEFTRDGGGDWTADSVSLETIYELSGGPKDAWRTAAYAEIEQSLKSEGMKLELKGLVEYRDAPWNLRGNLILERAFGDDASDDVEIGYAVRAVRYLDADWAIGLEGLGDLGTIDRPTTRAAHYWGPIVATELHFQGSELEIQAGYLFGFGEADAEGQFRLELAWEFPGV